MNFCVGRVCFVTLMYIPIATIPSLLARYLEIQENMSNYERSVPIIRGIKLTRNFSAHLNEELFTLNLSLHSYHHLPKKGVPR